MSRFYDHPLSSEISGLYDVPFVGYSVNSVGDIQGDGMDDIVSSTCFKYGYEFDDVQVEDAPPYWSQDEQANLIISGRSDHVYDPSDFAVCEEMSSFWEGEQRWLGDVNGDGYDDVVSCPWVGSTSLRRPLASQRIDIWHGSGSGLSATPSESIRPIPSKASPGWSITDFIGPGDVNSDGFTDLLVVFGLETSIDDGNISHELQLYFGSSGGIGDVPRWKREYSNKSSLNGTLEWMDRGDFNNDGHFDVILTMSYPTNGRSVGRSYKILVLHGSDGGMSSGLATEINLETGYDIWDSPEVTDFDGDGYEDLLLDVMVNISWSEENRIEERRLYLYYGSQEGLTESFDSMVPMGRVTYTSDSMYSDPFSLFPFITMDVTNDGCSDIVTYDYAYRVPGTDQKLLFITLFENQKGQLVERSDFEYFVPIDNTIDRVYTTHFNDVGDFDGDGLDDLVIGIPNGSAEYDYYEDNLSRPADPGHLYLLHGVGILERFQRLRVPEGPRLFADHKDYEFLLKCPAVWKDNLTERFVINLDPKGANIVLRWDSNDPGLLQKDDPQGYLLTDEIPVEIVDIDPLNRSMLIRFELRFNWNWPHEDHCSVVVECEGPHEEINTTFTVPDLFWIENDLDLVGPLSVAAEWQGPIENGDWIRGGERLNLEGPIVVYEGTEDVFPRSDVCMVLLHDDDGDERVSAIEPSVPVSISIDTDSETDLDEVLTLTLDDLPDPAIEIPKRDFQLRVDADLPVYTQHIPDGSGWHSSRTVWVSVTVSDGNTSGIDAATLEYSYATQKDPAFTDWTVGGLRLTDDGQIVNALVILSFPEGADNFIRWRVKDLVGNGYAFSEEFRVMVDTLNVTFSDMVPTTWQNRTEVVCGVTIRDLYGSGIEASTIQFRYSKNNLTGYGPWIDWSVGAVEDAQELMVRATVGMIEGEFNYVQWRAMDIAGNGYSTSTHHKISVDISPPDIRWVLPLEGVKQRNGEIMAQVEIREVLSGLDQASVQYRFRRDGDLSFGGWNDLDIALNGDHYIGRVDLDLLPGVQNAAQFRARDMAGNEARSEIRDIWVNRPPEANILSPENGTHLVLGETVILNGKGSMDPDEDEITFEWYINDGPNPISLDKSGNITLDVGWNKVALIVTDIDGANAREEVTVLVLEPVEPTTENDFDTCWVALVIILILLVAGGVLFLKKRMD